MQLHETGASQRTLVVLAVVACILQAALAPQLTLLSGRVNFMVALSLVLALSLDISSATVCGFFCGLFFDLTSSAPIGLMSLLLTLSSFAVSMMSRGSLSGLSLDSVRLVGLGAVAVNMVNAVALTVMGVVDDLLWSLGALGLCSAILTVAVAVLMLLACGGGPSSMGFSGRAGSLKYKKQTRLR